MDYKLTTIYIFGSNNSVIEKQYNTLSNTPRSIIKRIITPDFDENFDKLPIEADIAIINLTGTVEHQIKALENLQTDGKSVIVVGDKSNVKLLSAAISAGVSEFVNHDEVFQGDLLKAVNKIILNRTETSRNAKKRRINAITYVKGGSGCSVMASNIAYVLSTFSDSKVALLDMDMQFGTLGLNFDVVPKYTILDVLNSIDDVDMMSLDAYMFSYNERLRLLLPSADDIVLPGEVKPAAVRELLHILQRNYNQIVIDLPRIIDPISTTILEQADYITIVLQQTLAQYRDGRRMIQILNNDLEIPLDKIIIAINRYDPKNSLKKSDLTEMVNHSNVFTIANDYERVSSACNLGEPVCKTSPNAKISEDIRKLALFLGDEEENKKANSLTDRLKGLFG